MQIRSLERIRTEEEDKIVKDKLSRDMQEYMSMIQGDESPKTEAQNELRIALGKLTPGMESESERRLLSEIEKLKAKLDMIDAGTYTNHLRQNIVGYMLMHEEYVASQESKSVKDIIVGLWKGTPEVKEYLRKKYMLSFSNMYGIIPAPEEVSVEPVDAILNRMIKECNLVQITEEDIVMPKEETALVPVDGSVSAIRSAVMEGIGKMFDDCIEKGEYVHIPENKAVSQVPHHDKSMAREVKLDKHREDKGEREI